MDINQKIQTRLKQLSKFNNANLPQIFQCSKCRKYNTIISQLEIKVQNCYFCMNPNYINKKN